MSTSCSSSTSSDEVLPTDFVPGSKDVILARGARKHTGNKRLVLILEMNLSKYASAKTKLDKSTIVSSIVDSVNEASPEGGFVRKGAGGLWYRASEVTAREKVGQG